MHKDKRTYFYSGFLAYIFGILVTLVVMHVFKHPQVRAGLRLIGVVRMVGLLGLEVFVIDAKDEGSFKFRECAWVKR